MKIFKNGKLSTAVAMSAVTAGAIAMSVALVPTASAAPARDASASPSLASNVRSVCADSLYVRHDIIDGVVIGTLYRGQNFDVYSYSGTGQWVYGHAYGNVHKDGWVQNGWFC